MEIKQERFQVEIDPNHLQEIRSARHFSRQNLSDMSGVKPGTIQRIELNQTSNYWRLHSTNHITNTTADKLAAALHMEPEEIFEKYAEGKERPTQYVNPFANEDQLQQAVKELMPELQKRIRHAATHKGYLNVLTPEDYEEIAYQTLSDVALRVAEEGIPEHTTLRDVLFRTVEWRWRSEAKKLCNALYRDEYLELPLKFFCSQKEYQELQKELEKVKRLIAALHI